MKEPPPTMAGVMNALIVSAKLRMAPATTPGIASGTVTRRKAWKRLAPRLTAAGSSEGSSCSRALMSGRSMKGSCTWAMATRTPCTVKSSLIGLSISPAAIRPWLTSPCLPRSTIQPHARARLGVEVRQGEAEHERDRGHLEGQAQREPERLEEERVGQERLEIA